MIHPLDVWPIVEQICFSPKHVTVDFFRISHRAKIGMQPASPRVLWPESSTTRSHHQPILQPSPVVTMADSDSPVTLRTRKFIRNPLLGRKQMVV
jgi:hypothetical protein